MKALPASSIDDLARRYFGRADMAAIREVVAATRPRLVAMAARIAGADLAEDVVQTAHLALIRRGALPEAPLWAWLVTATVRIAYRQRAAARRLHGLPADVALVDRCDGPLDAAARAETVDRTRAAIASLPPRYRDAIVLRHLEGHRVADVAALLGVPRQTAKTRLRRAHAMLRVRATGIRGRAALVLLPLIPDFKTVVTTMGAVMKTKSLVLVGALVASAGTAGYFLRDASEPAPSPDTPEVAQSNPPTDAAPPPELVTPPEEERQAPRATLEGKQPSPAPVPTAVPPPTPRPVVTETRADKRARIDKGLRAYLDALKTPPTVAAAAKRLEVSSDVLRSMYGAEYLLHFATRQPQDAVLAGAADDALAELERAGEEGFRAVVANAQGNPTNDSRVDTMAKATWQPGYERELLDWLKAQPPHVNVAAALRMLGSIDTQEARDILLEGLARYEHHASNFLRVAQALAAHGNADKAALIKPKLYEGNWAMLRPGLLDALGRMGSSEAAEILVAYLRHKDSNVESHALRALARIDAPRARAEARALLDKAYGNVLEAHERRLVEPFAK